VHTFTPPGEYSDVLLRNIECDPNPKYEMIFRVTVTEAGIKRTVPIMATLGVCSVSMTDLATDAALMVNGLGGVASATSSRLWNMTCGRKTPSQRLDIALGSFNGVVWTPASAPLADADLVDDLLNFQLLGDLCPGLCTAYDAALRSIDEGYYFSDIRRVLQDLGCLQTKDEDDNDDSTQQISQMLLDMLNDLRTLNLHTADKELGAIQCGVGRGTGDTISSDHSEYLERVKGMLAAIIALVKQATPILEKRLAYITETKALREAMQGVQRLSTKRSRLIYEAMSAWAPEPVECVSVFEGIYKMLDTIFSRSIRDRRDREYRY
jgi:hypothetical protein